jgi:hypothetical protein
VVLGSIVFFYGGWVFILGALREIKEKNPGMMTLIALAISSACLYSIFITINSLYPYLSVLYLHKSVGTFWWELSGLITIMLLGHYFEIKSVSSAQRALKEIEKLLPDQAEVITADQFGFKTDDNGSTTTDEYGFETDKFGSTTTDQFGFKTDENVYKISKNPHISVPNPHISAGPHKSVQNPHKSVDTYLYFIEGYIP